MDMKCKVSNWMVLSVSNNKGFVTRGYYITKKFFSTYEDAREYMLEENHISVMHDFENSYSVFNNVNIAGGVSYFLWDKNNKCFIAFLSNMLNSISTHSKNEYFFKRFIKDKISH